MWKALFTRTQRRVLGLLFGRPDRSFYANELVRLAGVGTGAVQRELKRLTAAGIITVRRRGNQVHYQANTSCPVYRELRGLVLKTFGAIDHLRSLVVKMDGAIELAFIYGPGAEGLAAPGSPLDLLIVSPDLRRQAVQEALDKTGVEIGRNIRLVLLRPEGFASRLQNRDAKLVGILKGKLLVLSGSMEYPKSLITL